MFCWFDAVGLAEPAALVQLIPVVLRLLGEKETK